MVSPDHDEHTFFQQVLELQGELLQLLFTYTGNRDDAQELLGDVYLELVEMTAEERSKIRSPKAFCRTAAKHKACDWLRRKRVIRMELLADMDCLHHADERPPLDRIVIGQQELTLVERLIQKLPSRCREIFTRRRRDGVSIRGIAAEFNIRATTVKDHLARADAELLKRRHPDPPVRDDRVARNRRRRKLESRKGRQP